MIKKINEISQQEIDRIVEMAWEDRTPFDAIKSQFGLNEAQVIKLMRREMKLSSFKMWRERVKGRSAKHCKIGNFQPLRFKSKMQKEISHNKISKR